MIRDYDWGYVLFCAVFIIFVAFLIIGYFVIYYKCMYIPVSDLPGYCLSFL